MRLCALALVLLIAACRSSSGASTEARASANPATPPSTASMKGFERSCAELRGANALLVRVDTTLFPHPAYLENVAQQVARRLQPDDVADSIAATVLFLLRGDGSLGDLRVVEPSGTPAFDSATVRAIAAAGQSRAFGRLPERFGNDSLWVTLERRQPDGTRSREWLYYLEQPPRITRAIPLPPRPPYQAVDSGGRVRVRFVVDTMGYAEVHSFEVIEASHPELASLMQHVVGRTRFAPAEVGGCKVRREMQMGFDFQAQGGSR